MTLAGLALADNSERPGGCVSEPGKEVQALFFGGLLLVLAFQDVPQLWTTSSSSGSVWQAVANFWMTLTMLRV